MSTPHMILGALLETPDHGYNLKNRFFSKLTSDFGINDGQLYPALKKLEEKGFITKEIQTQEGSPNRHFYSITETGKNEFLSWLGDSDGEDRSFRYEILRKDTFFNKCIYINFLPKEKALSKIVTQIDITEKQVADFKNAVQDMSKRGVSPARVKIAEYALRNQETRLSWLREFYDTTNKQMEE